MYTRKLKGQIIFYFLHSVLFDEVQHQSAFMCKNVTSKEGEDLSERYAITDDEKPMFELCLADTLPDIYDVVRPITHGIDGAWYDNITGAAIKNFDTTALADLDVESDSQYVVVRVQDNEAYNPNTVHVVDSALRSTIESGVLAKFYLRVTHPELTKLSSAMYAGQSGSLASRIIPLRKKSKI